MQNYGTVDDRGVAQQETQRSENRSDDEAAGLLLPLPQGKSTSPAWSVRLSKHLQVNVSKQHGELPLLLCYMITGILDASSTITWGSFVSMQTGNTIYLGLGLAAPMQDDRWIRAAISLASFCAGSFIFSRYHRYFSARRRWVVIGSYIFEIALMTIAALMVTLGPVTGKDSPLDVWVVVPIALLAFQSAGQAVMSRVLKFNSLTSVVLTSIYCDLFSVAELFAGLTKNAERNRRVTAPTMLALGAFLAGVFNQTRAGLVGALWTAIAVKGTIVVTWWFWPAEKDEN